MRFIYRNLDTHELKEKINEMKGKIPENERKFIIVFLFPIFCGSLLGLVMAFFVARFIPHIAKLLPPFVTWTIAVSVPLIWIYLFHRKEGGLVNYDTRIIPNPFLTGISMGYFILVLNNYF